MAQSYADILRRAGDNSRSEFEKIEEERRKREKLNKKSEKSQPINNTEIQLILERRRREQEEQKLAEQRRLKQANQLKKQQKTVLQPKTQQKSATQPKQQTSVPPKPPNSAPPKTTSTNVKKPPPPPATMSYGALMQLASSNANHLREPKELTPELSRVKKSSTPTNSSSSITSKKPLVKSKSSKTPTSHKKPTSSSSTTITKSSSTTKPSIQVKPNLNKPKPSTSAPSSNNNKQPIRSLPTPASSTNRMINGQKSLPNKPIINGQKLPQNQTSNVQRLTTMSVQRLPSGPVNGQRPPPPANRMITPNRPSLKRPVIDTDDEDDEDLRDFIVDDDEYDNGFDYQKELQETLKKNFRFDKEKYRGRYLDDDDLRNMESSFDQIEKEEDYSRRLGLKEDIDDILREQAEKKNRQTQMKKRPKTAA